MIQFEDIKHLNLGSLFLSAGGGEETRDAKFLCYTQTRKSPINLVQLANIENSALVAIITFMGSPTVESEKNISSIQFNNILKQAKNIMNEQISYIVPLGIGGATVFIPMFFAGMANLPILDADCFGRCFSYLYLESPNLFQVPASVSFMTNFDGEVFILDCRKRPSNIEKHARRLANASHGACLIIPHVITGEQAKKSLIPGTITQALTIGKLIEEKRSFEAITEYTKGKFWGMAGIVRIDKFGVKKRPFNLRFILEGMYDDRRFELYLENEFFLLFEDGECIAEAPDIVTLCHPFTCEPIPVTSLIVGTMVGICTMKAPDIWYTERGLSLVRNKLYNKSRDLAFATVNASKNEPLTRLLRKP